MALALYLAVTVAIALLLRRLVSRAAAMVLIAMPLVFTAPAMFTNRTYAPLDLVHAGPPFGTIHPNAVHNSILTDVSHQIIPWNLAVRESVRTGEWPLWNRLMLAGDVLAASGQPAPYYPITVLGWLLPLAHALTFAAAMGFFTAGLGAYLFFRRIELSELASVFGAAAWMYATPVVFYLEWPLGTSVALLPLVLFGAEWLTRDAVPGAIALTVALTLLILAGHPESVLHVVGAAVVYALIRMRWNVRTIVAGVLAGVASLAITAIYLLPIQEALPQTVQYTMRREVFARMNRSVPWEEAGALAIRSFVPFAYGRLVHDVADDVPQRYWLSDNGYAGSVVLALAVVGLVSFRAKSRNPFLAARTGDRSTSLRMTPGPWLFLGFAVFGLLAGSDAPVVTDLLSMLPLFDIALNERLIFLCAFGLIALAAMAVDVMDGRIVVIAIAVFVLLAIAVVALWPAMREANLGTDLLAKNAAYLLLPLVLLPFVRKRPALLIGLLLAQRYFEMGDFWPTVDSRLASPKIAMPNHDEPYRVVGLGDFLAPNSAAYLGLEDVRGYQAMNLTFFQETWGLWSDAPPVGSNVVRDLSRPFLSLMNVRYAFVPPDTSLPDGWRWLRSEPTYAIAENTRALPRAFIPRTVICGVDALQAMTTETDFAARAWLRGDCGVTPFTNGNGRVRTTRRTPAQLTLAVDTDAPSWVVVTESAWRGWRATDASGKRLTLRRANHAFLAFQVPAGRSTVELRYRPRSFVLGAWISAAALVICIALISVNLRRRFVV